MSELKKLPENLRQDAIELGFCPDCGWNLKGFWGKIHDYYCPAKVEAN